MYKIWHHFIKILLIAAVFCLVTLRPHLAIGICLVALWALVGECWFDVYLNRRERIQAMTLTAA